MRSSLLRLVDFFVCYLPVLLLAAVLVSRGGADELCLLIAAFCLAQLLCFSLSLSSSPRPLDFVLSPLSLCTLTAGQGSEVTVFCVIVSAPLFLCGHRPGRRPFLSLWDAALAVCLLEIALCAGKGLAFSVALVTWSALGGWVCAAMAMQESLFYHASVGLLLHDLLASEVLLIEEVTPRAALWVGEVALGSLLAVAALTTASLRLLDFLLCPSIEASRQIGGVKREALSAGWRLWTLGLVGAAVLRCFSWPLLLKGLPAANPLQWLLDLLLTAPHCLHLVVGWIAAIAVTVWMEATGLRSWERVSRRKLFHFLVVAMFYPAIPLIGGDATFITLALCGAVCLFLLVEFLRLEALPGLAPGVQVYFQRFLSHSRGGIVTAHLTLLLAVALPWTYVAVLIWQGGAMSDFDPLAQQLGLLTVGIGDAVAAIVGRRFGRNRWPGSAKTLEGSAAGLVAMLVALSLWSAVVPMPRAVLCLAVVSLILSAAAEVFLQGNDNLTLPMYALIVSRCLFLLHSSCPPTICSCFELI
eukprot:gene5711-6295_t